MEMPPGRFIPLDFGINVIILKLKMDASGKRRKIYGYR